MVHDAVAIEEVEPLELKGKAEPVAAHRLLDVRDAPERVHESVFVGRSQELETLLQAWERVLARGPVRAGDRDRQCRRRQVALDRGAGLVRQRQERPRPLPLLRRGDHVLPGRRSPEAARCGSVRRHRSRCAPLPSAARAARSPRPTRSPGRSASCSRNRPRSSVFSTTSSGARRRSSISSSMSRCSRARRFSCSVSRGPTSPNGVRSGPSRFGSSRFPTRMQRRSYLCRYPLSCARGSLMQPAAIRSF